MSIDIMIKQEIDNLREMLKITQNANERLAKELSEMESERNKAAEMAILARGQLVMAYDEIRIKGELLNRYRKTTKKEDCEIVTLAAAKPSWDDAPEWANWLAMDIDGAWWWHNSKPVYSLGEWDSVGKSSRCSVPDARICEKTLEQRKGGGK